MGTVYAPVCLPERGKNAPSFRLLKRNSLGRRILRRQRHCTGTSFYSGSLHFKLFLKAQRPSSAENHGLLDDIAQLTDISGPRPLLQTPAAGFRKVTHNLSTMTMGKMVQIIPRQRKNILTALPKGRNLQTYDGNAVVKICTKQPLAHGLPRLRFEAATSRKLMLMGRVPPTRRKFLS